MALGITEEEFRYPVDYNPDIDFTTISQSELKLYMDSYKYPAYHYTGSIFPAMVVRLSNNWVSLGNKPVGFHPTIKDMLEPWVSTDPLRPDVPLTHFYLESDPDTAINDFTDEELEHTLPDDTVILGDSIIFSSSQAFFRQIAPNVLTAPLTLAKLNVPFEVLVPNASWLAKSDWQNIQPWVSLNTIDDYYYVIGFNLYTIAGAGLPSFDRTLLMQNEIVYQENYTPLTDSEKDILSNQNDNPLIFRHTLGELRAMKSDGYYRGLEPSDFLEPFADIIENHLTDLSKRTEAEIQGFKVKAPFKDNFSWTEIEPLNVVDWQGLINQRVQQDIDKYKSKGTDQDVALFNDDITPSGILSYEELLEYIDEIEEGGWFYERIAEEGAGGPQS